MTRKKQPEQVVIFKQEYPGLRLRMLADRDRGQVIWETEYLDEDGWATNSVERKILPVEINNINGVISLLSQAIKALTPVRRLDKITLTEPMRE